MKTMAVMAVATAVAVCGLALPCATAVPVDDAARGQALYRTKCAACHGADAAGGMGPDLHGIVGRRIAADPDFAYSAALRRSGKTWTSAELQAYLIKPQAAAPGTRMAFPGATPADAAALVAYLKTL